jgi:hypothetical protein
MRIVPKRPNHLGTGLKKILDILREGIGFFTLDIDGPTSRLHRVIFFDEVQRRNRGGHPTDLRAGEAPRVYDGWFMATGTAREDAW